MMFRGSGQKVRASWRRRQIPKAWPSTEGTTRTKVLIEAPPSATPWIIADILERAGYEPLVCEGPGEVATACHLLADGECPLVRDADVVYNGFGVSDEGHRAIIAALHDRHPDTPVVVEVTDPEAQRHPDLLRDCTTTTLPANAEALTDSIAAALDRAGADRRSDAEAPA